MYSRKLKGRISNQGSSKTSGTVLLGLILIWLPVLWIFGAVLWIKVQTLNYVKNQRALDRCVYSFIQKRCTTLNRLSGLNHRLTQIQKIIVAAQFAEVIPIIGEAVYVGEKAARVVANGLARSQDFFMAKHALESTMLLQCGFPIAGTMPLSIKRRPTLHSTMSKTPDPLFWENAVKNSEVHVLKDFKYHSYAHCSGDGNLAGEKYQILFYKPNHNLGPIKAPPLWNAFSSLFSQ